MVDFSIDAPDTYSGWFNKEMFTSKHSREFVGPAKSVVKQLQKKYDSGDPQAQAAVRNWEMERSKGGFTDNEAGQKLLMESLSKDKIQKDTLQDLFYEAFQKTVGSALTNEDKSLSPDKQQFLESIHGFDMGGYKPFDWDSVPGIKLPNGKVSGR